MTLLRTARTSLGAATAFTVGAALLLAVGLAAPTGLPAALLLTGAIVAALLALTAAVFAGVVALLVR